MVSFFGEVKIFIFGPKTMDYSPWFDFSESEKKSGDKDTIGKSISSGVEWRKFQLRSIYLPVRSYECTNVLIIHYCDDLYLVHTFSTPLEGAMKLKFAPICSF